MSQPHNKPAPPATEVTIYHGQAIEHPTSFVTIWVRPDGSVGGQVSVLSDNPEVPRILSEHCLSALHILLDAAQIRGVVTARDASIRQAVDSVLLKEEV